MQYQVQIQNLVEEFRSQLRMFKALTQKQGFHLPEEPEQALVQFASHPKALQRQICQNFAAYIETFLAAAKQNVKFHEGKKMLWYALQRLEMRPTSELFNFIEDDDIIEIYNAEGIQIYRNMNFYEVCSYSVGDILSYGWSELYERDPQISQQIVQVATGIFQGFHGKTFPSPVPPHSFFEKFSGARNILEMKQKYYSPLFPSAGGKQVIGAVATSQVRILD